MPRLHRRRTDTAAEKDRTATILRRLAVLVVTSAIAILLAAVVALVLLVDTATDANLTQAQENGRLSAQVKALVEGQERADIARQEASMAALAAREAIIDRAIGEIIRGVREGATTTTTTHTHPPRRPTSTTTSTTRPRPPPSTDLPQPLGLRCGGPRILGFCPFG